MSSKNVPSAQGDSVTGVIQATNNLANDVGPAWGLGIVVAIMLCFPKWGVIVTLAKLFKEDREDARKRNVEYARLNAKYHNRPQVKQGQTTPPKQLPKE